MLLPEDGDYCPRLADPRIGTLWSGKVNFSDKEQWQQHTVLGESLEPGC